MSKTFEELMERAFDIKCHFRLASYELHHFEDGSYCDFHVQKVVDLPGLVNLAGGLELKFFHDTNSMIVRLFERDCN